MKLCKEDRTQITGLNFLKFYGLLIKIYVNNKVLMFLIYHGILCLTAHWPIYVMSNALVKDWIDD